jgi:hypothetical protein
MTVSERRHYLLRLAVGAAVVLGLTAPLGAGPVTSAALAAPSYQTAPPPPGGGPPGGAPNQASVITPPPGTTVLSTTSLPPASPGVLSAEIPTGGTGSVGVVSSTLGGSGEVTAIVPAGGTALRVDVGQAPQGQMAGGDPNAVMSITLDVRNASSGANVTTPVQVGISPPANLTIPADATSVTVNVCGTSGACTPQTFTVDRTDPNKPILRAEVQA